MKLLAYIRSMGEKFFRPSQLSAEMDEELRSHIALRAEDLERSGLDGRKHSGVRASSSAARRRSKTNATRLLAET